MLNLLGIVKKMQAAYNMPDDEDYRGAIVALNRLEDAYLLNPSDIRNGKLSTQYPSRKLTG